jgi:ATP phosphoribosyltransferase regulatory subunit HisZ
VQVSLDSIQGDLAALGLEESVVRRLLEVIGSKDLATLEAEIGKDSPVTTHHTHLTPSANAFAPAHLMKQYSHLEMESACLPSLYTSAL